MAYNLKKIGKRISNRRRELDMTQNELASILHISNTHLSNIERGAVPPSFFCLLKFAQL